MSENETFIPPMPVAPVPAKKSRKKFWIGVVAALAILGGISALASPKDDPVVTPTATAPVAQTAPITPPVVPVACIDTETVGSSLDDVMSALKVGQAGIKANDPAVVAAALKTASDSMKEVAVATSADPDTSYRSSLAAHALAAASGDVLRGDYNSAGLAMKNANFQISAATRAVAATSVPAC